MTNVSGHVPGLAKDVEGRVYQIGVSPFDAGAAYVAIDAISSTTGAYVYKTGDYGKTWVDIGKGLPQDVSASRWCARIRTCALLGPRNRRGLWYGSGRWDELEAAQGRVSHGAGLRRAVHQAAA